MFPHYDSIVAQEPFWVGASVTDWIQAFAIVVLVGVTWWYAHSTRKILRETRRQADASSAVLEEMRGQARIMALSALVSAKRGFKTTVREEGQLEELLKKLP